MTGESIDLTESLGVAGSGTIACGLARAAADRGAVTLWARSGNSADRAREELNGAATVVTDLSDLSGTSFVVEAIAEDHEAKAEILRELDGVLGEEAILATTTSALSIERLAAGCGRPDRFVGLHVFNPVDKMQLVELVFPDVASDDTRRRTEALCESLGKTAVDVPDIPGFVVNRLLFPLLFAAVELLDEHDLDPSSVDACMKLGAGHPMGPLALLDFVGLDVAEAIGESIEVDVPARLRELIAAGKLGRKSGAGFYDYS